MVTDTHPLTHTSTHAVSNIRQKIKSLAHYILHSSRALSLKFFVHGQEKQKKAVSHLFLSPSLFSFKLVPFVYTICPKHKDKNIYLNKNKELWCTWKSGKINYVIENPLSVFFVIIPSFQSPQGRSENVLKPAAAIKVACGQECSLITALQVLGELPTFRHFSHDYKSQGKVTGTGGEGGPTGKGWECCAMWSRLF